MKQLTTDQADQIIMIEHRIEELRKEKERTKAFITEYYNTLTNLDIQIRKLRIELALIKPIEEKKHKETDEEKITRLTKEIEAIRNKTT